VRSSSIRRRRRRQILSGKLTPGGLNEDLNFSRRRRPPGAASIYAYISACCWWAQVGLNHRPLPCEATRQQNSTFTSTGCIASPRETLPVSDGKCLIPGPKFHVGFTLPFTLAPGLFAWVWPTWTEQKLPSLFRQTLGSLDPLHAPAISRLVNGSEPACSSAPSGRHFDHLSGYLYDELRLLRVDASPLSAATAKCPLRCARTRS
jgi:hypothetical protein